MSMRMYSIGDSVSLLALSKLCEAVFQIEAGKIGHAFIDAISDYESLDEVSEEARSELMGLAAERFMIQASKGRLSRRLRKGPSPMGIELDLSRVEHRTLFQRFGPVSIHAEAYRSGESEPFFVLHDGGTSVTISWESERLAELADMAEFPESLFEEVSVSR